MAEVNGIEPMVFPLEKRDALADHLIPRIPTPKLSFGGGERVRTDDLLRARQALSQLSYTPIISGRAHRTPSIVVFALRPLLYACSLVGLDGIEPSTSRLSGVRSNRTELQAL
jgi:hypothetical protein